MVDEVVEGKRGPKEFRRLTAGPSQGDGERKDLDVDVTIASTDTSVGVAPVKRPRSRETGWQTSRSTTLQSNSELLSDSSPSFEAKLERWQPPVSRTLRHPPRKQLTISVPEDCVPAAIALIRHCNGIALPQALILVIRILELADCYVVPSVYEECVDMLANFPPRKFSPAELLALLRLPEELLDRQELLEIQMEVSMEAWYKVFVPLGPPTRSSFAEGADMGPESDSKVDVDRQQMVVQAGIVRVVAAKKRRSEDVLASLKAREQEMKEVKEMLQAAQEDMHRMVREAVAGLESVVRRGLIDAGWNLPEGWCFSEEVVERLCAALKKRETGRAEALAIINEQVGLVVDGHPEEAD